MLLVRKPMGAPTRTPANPLTGGARGRRAPGARDAADARFVAQGCVETPWGTLLLAATARGLAGAWFDGQAHHPGTLSAPQAPEHPLLLQAAAAIAAYAEDPTWHFALPLDAAGTPFQQQVWQALREIPVGQTRSYGAIAQALGRPNAARAVGAAVGRNPLSVIVPCHRVLGHGGALTGYAGGLARKARLLQHEGLVGAMAA